MKERKIIIVEGRDRIGKTTCIKSLISRLQKVDYNVITLYSKAKSNTYISTHPDDTTHYLSIHKENNLAKDWCSSSLEMLSFTFKAIFEASSAEKTVIIIDRFHLSSYAYGVLLREKQFLEIHKSKEKYLQFSLAFEEYIQAFSDVSLITIVTDAITDKDDSDNPTITVNADVINRSNKMFRQLHRISIIDDKHLIVANEITKDQFDTLDQFDEVIANIFPDAE